MDAKERGGRRAWARKRRAARRLSVKTDVSQKMEVCIFNDRDAAFLGAEVRKWKGAHSTAEEVSQVTDPEEKS